MSFLQICVAALFAAFGVNISDETGKSDNATCAAKHEDCKQEELDKLLNKTNERDICNLGPGIVRCLETVYEDCDENNWGLLLSLRSDIYAYRTKLKNCKNTGLQTRRPFSGKCSERFSACFTEELKNASKQVTCHFLCRVFPTTLSCLKSALTYCIRLEDDLKVTELSDKLTNLKKNYVSSKDVNDTCKLPQSGLLTTTSFVDKLVSALNSLKQV